MKKIVSLSLAALVLLAVGAFAYPGKHHGKRGQWWSNDKIVEQLNLTDQQKSKIDEIASSRKGTMENLHEQLKADYKEFHEKMKNPNSTDNEILSAHDRLEKTHREISKARIEMQLAMRKVLTHDQIVKLFEIKEEFREHHMKDREHPEKDMEG